MDVALGRHLGGMAADLLDDLEAGAEVDELRRAAMAQKVRGHGALDAGGRTQVPHELLDRPNRQTRPALGNEQRTLRNDFPARAVLEVALKDPGHLKDPLVSMA